MSAGDALKAAFGAEVQLVKSSGGVFEVTADDSLVFSKRSLRRFPEAGELEGLIRAHPASGG